MNLILNNKEINLEFKNLENLWCQGPTAFKEGQQSVEKIEEFLKLSHGSSLCSKDILTIMMKYLGHLNGISIWKLKNLTGHDIN